MSSSSSLEEAAEGLPRAHLTFALHHIHEALNALDKDTEYLRDELDALRASLGALFSKMDRDDILRRDREALHNGMLENVGG